MNDLIYWIIPIIIILLIILVYYKTYQQQEGFNLDTIKKEIKIGYQTDNPQIQYSINPVPYLIDFLRARSYYPSTLPRRPDSIINPMREPILRVDSVENTGNLPSIYDPPYAGPEINGVYRSYRYPHNDLLYTPWSLEVNAPYLDYGSQQSNN